MKDVVLNKERNNIKELSKRYCKSENYVLFLFKICKDLNFKNTKKEVGSYLFSVSKGVSFYKEY